jgi:chromosome partitioning protein
LKIVSIVNGKGGVAKTTTAVNLAAAITQLNGNRLNGHPKKKNKRTLLIDTDPQVSATWWVDNQAWTFDLAQETNPQLLTKLRSISEYDVAICDTPPSLKDQALTAVIEASDFVILPCPPSSLDMAALIQTINSSIKPLKVPYRILLTKVDPRRLNNAVDSQSGLRKADISCFNCMIRHYTAHEQAALLKKTIFDYQGKNADQAKEDYQRLFDELRRECSWL